jgi:hypothetical protein
LQRSQRSRGCRRGSLRQPNASGLARECLFRAKSAPMTDLGVRQGHLSPVIRSAHGNQAGLRRFLSSRGSGGCERYRPGRLRLLISHKA